MVLAGAGLAAHADATGRIILDKEFPTDQEQVSIQVVNDDGSPVAGADVSVTYRPGSRVSATDEIGRTTEGGTLEWTPMDPGIATLTATWTEPGLTERSSSTTVSVRFHDLPIDGIFIMVVAGLLLIVGSAIRVYKLLRAPDLNY